MAGELRCYVACRRWVGGGEGEGGFPLFAPTRREGAAEQHLVAGLMPVWRDGEQPAMDRIVVGRGNRPAGDDAGKAGDVGLRIAAVDAQRVELQDLAGKILVEAALAGKAIA